MLFISTKHNLQMFGMIPFLPRTEHWNNILNQKQLSVPILCCIFDYLVVVSVIS